MSRAPGKYVAGAMVPAGAALDRPDLEYTVSVELYRMYEKSGTNGNFIYYLHYMLYMFIPTLYAFSQQLYHVRADFSRHIGIGSSITVRDSLPKLIKISYF
jgi:hypothetical protein